MKLFTIRKVQSNFIFAGIFLLILFAVLLSISILFRNSSSLQNQNTKFTVTPSSTVDTKISPTITNQPGSSCVITNCHGLDVQCGNSSPGLCTMDFELGDQCRRYAECSNTANGCAFVETDTFRACQSCIFKCEEDFGQNDSEGEFNCAGKCP